MTTIRRFPKQQEKEICGFYFNQKLSTLQLGKKFYCDHSVICAIIKRNGFKLRSLSEAMKGKGRFGAKNSNWKGGRRHDKEGYILLLRPNHPNADTWGYVREHRLIMEKHLDRFLNSKEVVHHINGNPNDNRLENLMLFNDSGQHLSWHRKIKKENKLLQKDFCANF